MTLSSFLSQTNINN